LSVFRLQLFGENERKPGAEERLHKARKTPESQYVINGTDKE
jgi:hypothetical protein